MNAIALGFAAAVSRGVAGALARRALALAADVVGRRAGS